MYDYMDVWTDYCNGTISSHELHEYLDRIKIRGMIYYIDKSYTGYDYENQCWITLTKEYNNG